MALAMELELEKGSNMDQSPNTVLPTLQKCSELEKTNTKVKPLRKDELRVKQGFTEISFLRYRSSSCKSIPSRSLGLESNIELKRGSVYQSSREVSKMKKMDSIAGRSKIELSRSSDTSFSFRIVNSLCSLDEEIEQERPQVVPVNSNLEPSSVGKSSVEPCSSDGFIEIDLRDKKSSKSLDKGSNENLNFTGDQAAQQLKVGGNDLVDRDTVMMLHKSHSAKLELPSFPSPSVSAQYSRASSRGRLTPIKKMFDPFVKSKSLRSRLSYVIESDEVKTTGKENSREVRTFRKPLLPDFSDMAQSSEVDSQCEKADTYHSSVADSPVHLHGHLKLEKKHEMPFFVFSLDCPEDVYVAQTWKADNAFQWVYTFHSTGSRKKSNASVWGVNDCGKESSLVGQMQVSCYLWSELKDGGVFGNSMVKEFVLYDIAHAKQSVSRQEYSTSYHDHVKPSKGSNPNMVGSYESDNKSDSVERKHQPNHVSDDWEFDASSESNPWAAANLHPDLEIAAIIIQDPFEKRESLKYTRGDKIYEKTNLLNLSSVDQNKKGLHNVASPERLKVIVPTGNHGLPSSESRGPSSLLERWRLGGGCDCGGWDMSCPLIVFGNPSAQCTEERSLVDNHHPLELFIQGSKEHMPALTMKYVEEGQYAVDFHAQLSTLQAFSICVAVLHDTEASAAFAPERTLQLSQCNSLKALIEEEVKFLIDAVTEEEKKVAKKVKEISPSYLLNPPFSPIARV